jgi:hypothetical protein
MLVMISQWPRGLQRGLAAACFWECEFQSLRGHRCLSPVSVAFCQVDVSVSGSSPVQRSPTECGVSECDSEAAIMGRPWSARGCCAMIKNAICDVYRVKLGYNAMTGTEHFVSL